MSDFLPITLPSKCIPYSGIRPEDILIRPYNGGDEIILAQINPVNLERNFLAVLKNVVRGIDPSQLTTGDRLYIIMWEYINSYSEKIRIKHICSHCLQEVEFEVNLKTDLQIAKLPDNYLELQTFTLPVSKETVQCRCLNLQDEVECEKMSNNGKDVYMYRFARSIMGIDDPFAHMERMKKWEAKDIARIRKFHDIDVFHGPTSEAKSVCPNCREEEEIIVPFRFEFLYPTGEALGSCFRA